MKYLWLTLILTSFSQFGIHAEAALEGIPTISISSLSKNEKAGFVFKTKAYIVFVYKCPKCPVDAQCKPCMANNIVISEKPDILKDYRKLGAADMVVYTVNPLSLELGKKYEFSLKLRADESSADLISFLKLK